MIHKLKFIIPLVAILTFVLIQCSKVTDPEPEPVSIITLMDADIPKGKHSIMWDQKDTSKQQVADGDYRAALELADYTKYADFNISSQNDRVLPPKGIVIFPATAPLSLNAEKYGTGDSVFVYFELEDKQHVELSIEQY